MSVKTINVPSVTFVFFRASAIERIFPKSKLTLNASGRGKLVTRNEKGHFQPAKNVVLAGA